MAHAMPVRESVTFSFFWVASSPWKSRSPMRTCSMNASSNALSCSGVCFALWPCAGDVIRTNAASATPTVMNPCLIFMTVPSSLGSSLVRTVDRPLPVRDARVHDLVHVVRASGVGRGVAEHVLPPHDVLVVHLARRVHGQLRPAHTVERVTGVRPDHAPGQRRDALRRV